MTKISVIDCETTGIEDDAEVVEIAALTYDFEDGSPNVASAVSTLVAPANSIPATASAIHHITDDMVAGAPSCAAALERFAGDYIFVAHNAKFDRRFLGSLGSRWVCTYKCAIQQWPDAPSHSNQVLSYWLKTPRPPEGVGHTHRAMFDAWTTAWILEALKGAGWSLQRMMDVTSNPVLLAKFRFGKHANVPLAQVPTDYLRWMSGQDFDEDVSFTVRSELERRA